MQSTHGQPNRAHRAHREDLDPQETRHRGARGLFELSFRRHKLLTRIVTLIPLYGIAVISMGISAAPGLALFRWASSFAEGQAWIMQAPILGTAAAAAYLSYGFCLILVVPTINWLLRLKLKEWRGTYHSYELLPWFTHNGLTYLARYTFLELVTPTPFNIVFYRLMGMKIGEGTELNTTHISDPSLIQIGNKVTVGGSVAIMAHYAAGGFMVLSRVVIEDGATLGLRAIVMGGARIGAKARILPNSVVLPKTHVPAGETWGGIPAQRIDPKPASSQDPQGTTGTPIAHQVVGT